MDSRSFAAAEPRFDAAIRLATGLSMLAVVFAVLADLAGVAHQAIVLTVILAGFVASWVLTGTRIPPVGTLPRPEPVPVDAS